MAPARTAAYFTMEVAISDDIPTFSGGLGVLAGDYLRSAADLSLPIVAVSLLWRRGYFRQRIDESGRQVELPVEWSPEEELERLDERVSVEIEGREVRCCAWRHLLEGVSGHKLPIYFLDTDLEENAPEDRMINDQLYQGDSAQRLRQEAILGLGGVAMLRRLGHDDIETYHMNEGHSALLTLALLDELGPLSRRTQMPEQVAAVAQRCVFTTHTPVEAGHDRFSEEVVEEVLGGQRARELRFLDLLSRGELNMTELGLACSRHANGVARRHGAVAREMFPNVPIGSITNGVHLATWAAPSTVELFDAYAQGWRSDSSMLRYAEGIPLAEIGRAHAKAKARLLEEVERRTRTELDPSALTIGLARRATPYKRLGLLFTDLERLARLTTRVGAIQIVCSGKAHPQDEDGKALLAFVARSAKELDGVLPVVLLQNYDLGLAKLVCAGSDVWLNTPMRPNEASGTSGMKAALNGVPSCSVLDGWWIEGWIEGVTGWAIGEDLPAGLPEVAEKVARSISPSEVPDTRRDDRKAAESLYAKLEHVIAPLFFGDPDGYRAVMRAAMAINGSFFSTDRMAREYALNAYGWPVGARS